MWDEVAVDYTGSDYFLIKDQVTFTIPQSSDSERTMMVYVDPPAGGTTTLSTTTDLVDGEANFVLIVTKPTLYKFLDFTTVDGYELAGDRHELDEVDDMLDADLPFSDPSREYLRKRFQFGTFDRYISGSYHSIMEDWLDNTKLIFGNSYSPYVGGWNGESLASGNARMSVFSPDSATSVGLFHGTGFFDYLEFWYDDYTIMYDKDRGDDVQLNEHPEMQRLDLTDVSQYRRIRGQYDRIHNEIPSTMEFRLTPSYNGTSEINSYTYVVTEDTWVVKSDIQEWSCADPSGTMIIGYTERVSGEVFDFLTISNGGANGELRSGASKSVFLMAGTHVHARCMSSTPVMAVIGTLTHAPILPAP